MKVICIKDGVDGLTKGKVYEVTNLFIRNDCGFLGLYGLRDNYGVYNEYNVGRFNIIDGEKIELKSEKNGLILSILLQ